MVEFQQILKLRFIEKEEIKEHKEKEGGDGRKRKG